jgi:hypothetical protein
MATHQLISSITNISTNVVSFTNIPPGYNDLKIVIADGINVSSILDPGDVMGMKINGDTGSNYYNSMIYFDYGAYVYSGAEKTYIPPHTSTYANVGLINKAVSLNMREIYISNYNSSGKILISTKFYINAYTYGIAYTLWNGPGPITSLSIYDVTESVNFYPTNIYSLYGISNK